MLTDKQIDIIKKDLNQNGIRMPGLENDLLDHLLCSIEVYMSKGYSFEEAYRCALYDLHGESTIITIQQETIHLINEGRSRVKNLIYYGCLLSCLIAPFNLFTTGVNPGLILVCISLSIFFIYHSIFLHRKQNDLRRNLFLFTIITSLAVLSVFIFLFIEFEGKGLLGMLLWVSLILAIAIPFYLKAIKRSLSMNNTMIDFFSFALELTAIISLLWIPLALSIKLFRSNVAVVFFLDDLVLIAICAFSVSIMLKKAGELKLYLQKYL
ncbi:hypothetical protein QNI16_33640 [Cytophagaceae bacterium YF14B1]|uniref:Uncharacterized protein n=1 Tax=Xanthocytophaga flava TaxID=3048013 RepID=A0AAE3QU41_9BACT|nr:hypothetical protein [Xanthocytophaga flavus]MDJ1485482.1 hypothetical protein [Xanthocytophaga flavus]